MKNDYKKEVYASLALISQLGIHIMVPTILCTLIGVYVDGKFGTFLTLPLLVIGILSGGRNAYVLAKKASFQTEGEKKSIEEQKLVDEALKSWKESADKREDIKDTKI